MSKEDIIRKLTSRKFYAAVGDFVSMLIIALGGTEETSVKIVALIMAGGAVIAYIVGEGLADAAGARATTPVLQLPSQIFSEDEEPPAEIDAEG